MPTDIESSGPTKIHFLEMSPLISLRRALPAAFGRSGASAEMDADQEQKERPGNQMIVVCGLIKDGES